MTFLFSNLKSCETCQGQGQLIQSEGPMIGMVIPCPDCAGTWEDWANQYGSDEEDGPTVYVDEGGLQQVKENKGEYLIMLDGTELLLNKPV